MGNYKTSKFTHISSASQPAVRPDCASYILYMASDFLHNKGNHIFYKTVVLMNIYSL